MKSKTEIFNTEKSQSKIYSFDKSVNINVDNKIINFKDILIEHKKSEGQENIFLACDNIPSELVLEISKAINISIQDISHIKNSEKVSVIFSLKEDILNKYIKNKKNANLTDIKDEKGVNILFSLKYYVLDELLAYAA
ncbi:MAG: hypothetical protein U0457_00600 [Candidatus Sericytochromatia bacterium]